jgi:hypothetical protein
MMNNSLKTATLITIAAACLSIGGCKETELPVPLTTQRPSKDTTSPGTPPPASPTPVPGNPPTSETPSVPSAPSVPGQLRKIKWAPLDFKEFEYNAAGGLVKYNRQYNNVQGTDMVQRDEYTYGYDAAGKVISVVNKEGFRTEYTYSGDVWSEALSYDKLNRPLKKYTFQFNSKKQLVEYAESGVSLNGTTSPRSKTTFTYDGAGNLVRYVLFWYVESSQSFVRSTELQFSNFDNKKYPKNADSFDYVLQPLAFFVNNPGKKEFVGSYSPIEHYSYTYDVHGYPNLKRTTYTYDKPLPAMEATFEY